MANMVAGDLYESITGQLFEIGRQLRQLNGYPFDAFQLKAHLQAAIEGRFGSVFGNFRHDKRKDGLMLLENQPRRISGAIIGIPFHKDGEDNVNGEETVRRSRIPSLDANLGQEDAEWLLENQDNIPTELRNFVLIFTATIWQYRDGDRIVPCLDWGGGGWCFGFRWLGSSWGGFRLPRLRE